MGSPRSSDGNASRTQGRAVSVADASLGRQSNESLDSEETAVRVGASSTLPYADGIDVVVISAFQSMNSLHCVSGLR